MVIIVIILYQTHLIVTADNMSGSLIMDAIAEFDAMVSQLSRGKPVRNIDSIAIKFMVANIVSEDPDAIEASKAISQYLVHMNNYIL